MIKLVAFDWNGTLLADTQATLNSDNFALKKMGLKTITLRQYQQAFDIPIMKYWENLGYSKNFVKRNFKKLQKYYSGHYELLENKCRARKGAKDCLVWLKKNNIHAIIYSNHVEPHIHKQLIRLRIEKSFKQVLARKIDDNSHHYQRGKEQKLQAYVKEHKLKPKEVVSVGDTEEEVEIGKKLGYHTVAITGGWNSVSRLKKHHPDYLIHNMLELKKIVEKLNNN